MKEEPFYIPNDFRAFMQRVIMYIDTPVEERYLDAEDALQDETGYGGRIAEGSYRFTYITSDGLYKWVLPLREAAIRDIADGLLVEIMGERNDNVRTKERVATGEPLVIWGEYAEDSLAVRSEEQFLAALDALQAASHDKPQVVRMWSTMDDQVVAVINGDACAVYVVESADGYATTVGDQTRNDAFIAMDHEGMAIEVPWADCIAWTLARAGLLRFVARGELGKDIALEGRIPSLLLMFGDIDRKAAIAERGEAPHEVTRSSVPNLTPAIPTAVIDDKTTPVEVEAPMGLGELSAWSRRLIEALFARGLVELAPGNLDELSYQLASLLQTHAALAEDSIETAEWLANEIGCLGGIQKLFATGGDLQIALRRSRTP